MITVTYEGKEFSCAAAYKGPDYVRLLDEAGCRVASFEGIVDFSLFTISGGDWSEEPKCEECTIPVVMPDGSIRASDVKCGSIPQVFFGSTVLDFGTQYFGYGNDGVEFDIKEDVFAYPGYAYTGEAYEGTEVLDGAARWAHTFELPAEVIALIKSGMHAYVTLINPMVLDNSRLYATMDGIGTSRLHTFSHYVAKYFIGAFIHPTFLYEDGVNRESIGCSLTFEKNMLDVFNVKEYIPGDNLDGSDATEVLVRRYRAYYAITCVPTNYTFPLDLV